MVTRIHIQEPEGADANHDAEGSSFVSLGSQIEAVVMRLKTRLPRVKVASLPLRGRGTEEGSH